jgi:hypothetical protein
MESKEQYLKLTQNYKYNIRQIMENYSDMNRQSPYFYHEIMIAYHYIGLLEEWLGYGQELPKNKTYWVDLIVNLVYSKTYEDEKITEWTKEVMYFIRNIDQDPRCKFAWPEK